MLVRRRPCRCFRVRPCQIAIAGADAPKSRKAVLALVRVAEEALQAVEVVWRSPAEAAPYTLASEGTHWEPEAGSNKADQAQTVDSIEADRKSEAGTWARE
jgi:hypothetical protein